MPTAFPAEIPSLIRCSRKDEEHINSLRDQLLHLIELIGGPKSIIKYNHIANLAAQSAYFTVTTLSGLQTLGEEYLSLIQTDSTQKSIPSIFQRFTHIFLQIFTPTLLNSLEKKLKNVQETPNSLTKFVHFLKESQASILKINLSLFYIFGTHYHISKRISGVKYLSLRSQTNSQILEIFRIIGYLSLAQISVNLLKYLTNKITENIVSTRDSTLISKPTDGNITGLDSPSTKIYSCPICLNNSKPSCIPCGHILCWNCAIKIGNCPICRTPFKSCRIVAVNNL